jgi:MAF protein
LRLARAKAEALQARHSDSLIIGSDQVAVCEGRLILKPADPDAAFAQLQSLSGRQLEFLTAVALLNARSGRLQLDYVPYRVRFRTLEHAQISRYLQAEQPFDCAGSFKSEGLGIALLRNMEGEDPTALIGLPLIRLVAMLALEGVDVLALASPGRGYPDPA